MALKKNKKKKKKEKEEVVQAFPPWADLPEFLWELILEHLPLLDYIRFAAVCQRWQSIQKQHRLRHSPFPPPMAHPLPWLIRHHLWPTSDGNDDDDEEEEQGLLDFYSPLERKHHRLPLPRGLRPSRHIYCLASSHGCLLMTSHEPHRCSSFSEPISTEPFLFNPVTCAQIPLPPLSITPDYSYQGALSAPPTDPESAVLIMGRNGIFLHRMRCHGDGGGWIIVGNVLRDIMVSSIVACGGKFYCLCSIQKVGIIDPLLHEPMLQFLDFNLEFFKMYALFWPFNLPACYLVENEGEVFFVEVLREELDISTINGFRVFRADPSRNERVRVETLGDCAIFLDSCSALSLVAADVGFKKNTIYFSQHSECYGMFSWRVFDLDTGSWIDGTPVSYLEVGCRPWHNCWFLPMLDCVDA